MSTWRAVTFDGLDAYAADAAKERGGDTMSYDGFEDAMGTVDDIDGLDDYGILDDLGLPPEATQIIPPAAGFVTAYGAAYLLRRFVKPGSIFHTYAGGFGAVASLLPAWYLWKKQGKGAAITTATTGVLTGLGLWLLPKLGTPMAGLGAYVTEEPVPLLQGYEVEQAMPLLQGPPELLSAPPELLSEAPELLSQPPQLLSDQPEVVSGMGTMGAWSPAFV